MIRQFAPEGAGDAAIASGVDFVAFASALHAKIGDARYSEAFGDAFDLFDVGKSGELTRADILDAMSKLGETMTEAEAEELLKVAKKKDDFVRTMVAAAAGTGASGGAGAAATPAAATPAAGGGATPAAAAAPSGGAPRPGAPPAAPGAMARPPGPGAPIFSERAGLTDGGCRWEMEGAARASETVSFVYSFQADSAPASSHCLRALLSLSNALPRFGRHPMCADGRNIYTISLDYWRPSMFLHVGLYAYY
jgi:hypothetical protein